MGLAMFGPCTKFEVFTITYKKDMKGNAKCTNSRFEQPFRGLQSNTQSSCMESALSTCYL